MKFNFVSYETMTLDITRYSKSLRRLCIDYGNLITTDSDKTGTFECFFLYVALSTVNRCNFLL